MLVPSEGAAPPASAVWVRYRYTNRDRRGAPCVDTLPASLPADRPCLGRFIARPPRFERGQTGVKARRAAITQGAIVYVAPQPVELIALRLLHCASFVEVLGFRSFACNGVVVG